MAGDLGSAIEELCDQLPAAEARATLESVKGLLEKVVEGPAAQVQWTPPAASVSAQARGLIARCLACAGFVESASCFQRPAVPADAAVQEGLELARCLLETMETPMDISPEGMEADDELAEALRLSMAGATEKPEAKRPAEEAEGTNKRERSDAEVAAQLANEEEKQVNVEFERFRGEDVEISEEAVREINAYCAQSGEQYVDPQFPPTNRSLYVDESDASSWECFQCHARSPLPPVPSPPSSEQEAVELEASFNKVKCSACGEPASFVVKNRYFNRPTQWLRPGVRCSSCLVNAAFEYPGIRDPSSFIEIMCTHYLRCKSTKKTLGQPWVLIRSEPRPEDVQQGALGNCWFAAALSIVAAKPDLISSLFITKEYNPHGAYQLQLFHAGEWRGILVDDLFPTSQVLVGRLQGEMVYYSRGGTLSYLSCARHQLWVPMVEKAAAKLSGSYGNLSSGTFGEALALFTGFPTERIILYIPAEQRRRRAELRDQKIAQRTQMLLRGETPPDEDDDDDLMLDDSFRDDLLWSKLLSFREAGYLMGMGCTEQGVEKSKQAILDVGLQAPHAYGILDVRECPDASGKVHRLIQIRNPWGEDAPRTWKGDWGKDSPKWTFDMKLKLGVVNRSNVEMYDPMSIFWMSFEDVKEYFAVVEVCRVHDNWEEYRERAWLPSGVGPGEAFDLTVYERTQVDLALWQERHITRESAIGASTNVDVGLAVLRRRGANADGSPEFDSVEYVRRSSDNCCSQELILEGGYVYRLAPLCFSQMQQMAPRRVTCVVHSSNPVSMRKVSSSWRDVACAAFGAASKGRSATISAGVRTSLLHERLGYVFGVENASDAPFALQIDSNDSLGMVSSREGGACGCIDLIPPGSRKVVMALAPRQGVARSSYSFAVEPLPPEAAAWAVGAEDLHMAVPLTPLAALRDPPPADPAILQTEPPPRRRRPLAHRGGHKTPKAAAAGQEQLDAEAEAALAEAVALSMQGGAACAGGGAAPGGQAGEEEDELAEAIRLSMVQPEPAPPPPERPPEPAPPRPQEPAASGAAPPVQQLVKQLFEEYSRGGLNPNEAAAKAMAEAKLRTAPAPGASGARNPQQAVKELFEEYRRQGLAPNEAAVKAVEEAKRRASA